MKAGCRCGRVRYAFSAPPFFRSYCHCDDCRHATGAPVTAFAGFLEAEVERLAAEPARWSAREGVERSFCPECGAPIGYRDAALPGELYFYVGAFDEPERLCPDRHAYVTERLGWFETADDLPQLPATSRARP